MGKTIENMVAGQSDTIFGKRSTRMDLSFLAKPGCGTLRNLDDLFLEYALYASDRSEGRNYACNVLGLRLVEDIWANLGLEVCKIRLVETF